MKKSIVRLLVVGLALATVVPAAFAAPGHADSLSGTSWQLLSYGAGDAPTLALDGSSVTLQFTTDGKLAGNAGCNNYSGSYNVDNGALTVSPIVSTRRACVDGPTTQQESAYLALLQAAKSYTLDGGTLIITTTDGQQIVFSATPSLTGTQWQLASYGTGDAPTPVIDGSSVTLTFTGSGQALGNGGCNRYSAAVTLDGDRLTLSSLVSTEMACADDAVTQQESAYFAALGAVTRYELNGDTLTLWTSDDQPIVFTAAALAGSQWQLSTYGQETALTAALPDAPVTIQFEGDQVSGSASCNSYGGSYQVDGDTLILGEIPSTLMACLDAGVMEQEQAFLNALRSVSTYKIDGNTLTIHYAEGVLTFTRAASPALTPEATAVSS